MIPEEIGFLQQLRYLRFSVLNANLLPRSLSSLYHLQFIIFDDYLSYLSNDYFPSDMNNLFKLRYLGYSDLNFPGIGKLKFLQELRNFNIKNENGYKIEELEQLNELRILSIANLEDVRDVEEARNAKLYDKKKLTRLLLNWGIGHSFEDADRDLEERVLDNLQTHNYLTSLWIYYYMGGRSAIWMNEAHFINNLQEIDIHACSEWEILPPFGQLPILKTLQLRNMRKVKRLENKFHWNDISCVFPSLEILHLEDLAALVEWFDASVVDALFPCLTELRLE